MKGMALALSRAAFLGCLVSLVLLPACQAGNYYEWFKGTVTFYGGADGQGTIRSSACGYYNLYALGYGLDNAAASSALWDKGKSCGACYQVKCVNEAHWSYCKPGNPILVVTVTNMCPENNNGGACNKPRKHLDMSQPAFTRIAEYRAGIVGVRLRRVPCMKRGKVVFSFFGNPWFVMVLITNVAGAGDIDSVWVSAGNSNTWKSMGYDHGAYYVAGVGSYGNRLHFRIKTRFTGRVRTFYDAVPSNWQFGGSYESKGQFWVSQKTPQRIASM